MNKTRDYELVLKILDYISNEQETLRKDMKTSDYRISMQLRTKKNLLSNLEIMINKMLRKTKTMEMLEKLDYEKCPTCKEGILVIKQVKYKSPEGIFVNGRHLKCKKCGQEIMPTHFENEITTRILFKVKEENRRLKKIVDRIIK